MKANQTRQNGRNYKKALCGYAAMGAVMILGASGGALLAVQAAETETETVLTGEVQMSAADLLLGVGLFKIKSSKHLGSLAGQMLVLREQLVLGKLLGQGAAALGQRVGAQVGQQGACNGPRVDALVGHKMLVLGADDCVNIDLRQRIVGSIAPAGTDGVVHGSHWVTAGGTAVQLPTLIKEPAACQQPAKQQDAKNNEQALL